MPNINEFTDSKFLKGTDFPNPKQVTIRNIDKRNVARENQPKRMRAVATFEEFDKGMVMNTTNLKRAARVLGSENTDDWAGKRIWIFYDEEVEFGGEIVGGLRVMLRSPGQAEQRVTPTDRIQNMDDDVPF